MLRGLAGFLVIDNCSNEPDAVLLLHGDEMYERAALQYRGGVKQLLLIEGPPAAWSDMGILAIRN